MTLQRDLDRLIVLQELELPEGPQPSICPCCQQPTTFRCSACLVAYCELHLVSRKRFDRSLSRMRYRLYCCRCDPGPETDKTA